MQQAPGQAGPVMPPPPPASAPTPGQASPAPSPAASARSRATMIRAVLGILVLGLTVVALAVEEDESTRGYSDWTAWAIFATVMAAVHLLPLFSPLGEKETWTIVAVATAGLVFYWVAIILPGIESNLGFVQTLAVALAVAHLWLLPGRRI